MEALFALRATDDFADTRSKHIHRSDGALIFVEAHIERFDLGRVIHDDHRPPDFFFHEIALVLGLQIRVLMNWEFLFFF